MVGVRPQNFLKGSCLVLWFKQAVLFDVPEFIRHFLFVLRHDVLCNVVAGYVTVACANDLGEAQAGRSVEYVVRLVLEVVVFSAQLGFALTTL